MIQIGCLARFYNKYEDEVVFSRQHGFDFMQVWYDNKGIALDRNSMPKEQVIKEQGFPTIIHAVLDINEIMEHVPELIDILGYLGHNEVIIHPVCHSEEITDSTIYKLASQVSFALDMFQERGITLYLENNSRLDPIFNTAKEIGIVLEKNPNLELLVDIAHIEGYEHLKEIISIKMPKVLHIADKHFDVVHEHLPLGAGEIDYEFVFREILKDFSGKIILEITKSDEDIINSGKIIRRLLDCR